MLTQQGNKRKINQDYTYILKKEDYTIYCIADGMGGHERGEEASKIGVESFIINFEREYKLNPNINPLLLIRLSFMKANESVRLLGREEDFLTPGTTLIVLVLLNGQLYFGSVGDSYLVHYREHPVIMNRLHETWGGLTLFLGIEDDSRVFNEVDIGETFLLPGDFIVMCSDGIDMLRLIDEYKKEDLSYLFEGNIEQNLIEWSKDKTGDDCSVIVVKNINN